MGRYAQLAGVGTQTRKHASELFRRKLRPTYQHITRLGSVNNVNTLSRSALSQNRGRYRKAEFLEQLNIFLFTHNSRLRHGGQRNGVQVVTEQAAVCPDVKPGRPCAVAKIKV